MKITIKKILCALLVIIFVVATIGGALASSMEEYGTLNQGISHTICGLCLYGGIPENNARSNISIWNFDGTSYGTHAFVFQENGIYCHDTQSTLPRGEYFGIYNCTRVAEGAVGSGAVHFILGNSSTTDPTMNEILNLVQEINSSRFNELWDYFECEYLEGRTNSLCDWLSSINGTLDDISFIQKTEAEQYTMQVQKIGVQEEGMLYELLIRHNGISPNPQVELDVPVENKNDIILKDPDGTIAFKFKEDASGTKYIEFKANLDSCLDWDDLKANNLCPITTFRLYLKNIVEKDIKIHEDIGLIEGVINRMGERLFYFFIATWIVLLISLIIAVGIAIKLKVK